MWSDVVGLYRELASNRCLFLPGMGIALRELWASGERLISLPVFLRRMVDGRALAGEVADDVMQSSNQLLPTWWADWRART